MLEFIDGNTAIVRGAIYAGCNFFAGYPITPATSILLEMIKEIPGLNGIAIQVEDELAAIGVCLGAAMTGRKAMTATSGPGISLYSENIGLAIMGEVPLVIVDVQRMGPSTGGATKNSEGDIQFIRWVTSGGYPAIALCPIDVETCFSLTVKAFNLSEKFRTPVILLPDEVVAHMREKVEIPQQVEIINRKKPGGLFLNKEKYNPYAAASDEAVPVIPNFGEGFRFNITGLIHDETGFPASSPEITQKLITRLHKKIDAGYNEIKGIEINLPPGAEIAILSFGATFRSARQAAKELGAGTVKLTTLFPFPDKEIAELAKKVKAIIVAEMNLGQVVREVQRAVSGAVKVVGVNIANGALITPEMIVERIKQECR